MVTGMQRLASFFVVVLMCAVLPGCSGGGDDSPQPQTNSPPPGGGNAATIKDPVFPKQWHLKNTGQGGGTQGEDVNILPVWNRGLLGQGVRIHVVDDGIEQSHEDLIANIVVGQSYNFRHVDNGCVAPCTPNGLGPTDPSPFSSIDNHGTAVAGVAAASANSLGGRGAAPGASLVGYNILADNFSAQDSHISTAMSHHAELADINTNSWTVGEGGLISDSGSEWKAAVKTGVETGRSGRGTIYLFAAGNGENPKPDPTDDSNYSGYTNNRHVLAICSVDARGKKSNYSEKGANLWVCAPSNVTDINLSLPAISTTDRTGAAGYNDGDNAGDYINPNYTNTFGGTSSATPLAAGVTALVLQANPNLHWRDVRLILAETARKNDPNDTDWRDIGVNSVGGKYHHNHKYGFGVVNADAAVQRATTWTNVGPQKQFPLVPTMKDVNVAIPDNNPAGVTDTISVSGSGISSIEFLEITFKADHEYAGDLNVTLTHADTGIQSRLAEEHTCLDDPDRADDCGNYNNPSWVFGSARHLGEAADGTWTLKVSDTDPRGDGTFQSWQLTFYGR